MCLRKISYSYSSSVIISNLSFAGDNDRFRACCDQLYLLLLYQEQNAAAALVFGLSSKRVILASTVISIAVLESVQLSPVVVVSVVVVVSALPLQCQYVDDFVPGWETNDIHHLSRIARVKPYH